MVMVNQSGLSGFGCDYSILVLLLAQGASLTNSDDADVGWLFCI